LVVLSLVDFIYICNELHRSDFSYANGYNMELSDPYHMITAAIPG
jgi:hypothetical protein